MTMAGYTARPQPRDLSCMLHVDFSMQNRVIEEDVGLKKKRTEVEKTAEDIALGMSALRGMEL